MELFNLRSVGLYFVSYSFFQLLSKWYTIILFQTKSQPRVLFGMTFLIITVRYGRMRNLPVLWVNAACVPSWVSWIFCCCCCWERVTFSFPSVLVRIALYKRCFLVVCIFCLRSTRVIDMFCFIAIIIFDPPACVLLICIAAALNLHVSGNYGFRVTKPLTTCCLLTSMGWRKVLPE